MPFAAIYVADFAVEALARAEPLLREQALAVVEGTPPLLRVVGADERARRAGVEVGMTALQAEERLTQPRAAVPQIRRRSLAQEQAAHAALLDCACAFSPRVEDTAPDTIVLDMAGLERLFGPPAALACELARRVSHAGMQANVAIAANPDAAMHAARGFPGVTVIPPGHEAERLGGLPVDVLWGATAEGGCATEAMLETLDRWGVRTLRALAALPEAAVAQRLGQQGVRWQRLARGAGARPLCVAEPPLTFAEAVELEYPVALLEPLAFLLNRMLEQLCFRMETRALAVQELRLRLELDRALDKEDPPRRHGGTESSKIADCGLQIGSNRQSAIANPQSSASPRGGWFQRTLTLPVPMLDARVLLKLLQLDLQAHPPGAPVMKIWLEAEPAEPRRTQGGLFVPATPEAEKLELTLARIASVVSPSPVAASEERRVGSPEVLDTHRPDTFRMRKFDPMAVASRQSPVPSQSPVASQTPIAYSQSPTVLAMRMVRPPLAIAVEVREEIPRRIRETRNMKRDTSRVVAGEVVWAAGPWRGSGEWWNERPWSRETWDIALKETDGVALYRIYRDAEGAWFVEAEYD